MLDILMPDVDGFEVLAALGGQLTRLPVIAMTGKGDLGIVARAINLGSSDYIEKPFSEQLLRDMLEQVFSTLASNVGSLAAQCFTKARLAA